MKFAHNDTQRILYVQRKFEAFTKTRNGTERNETERNENGTLRNRTVFSQQNKNGTLYFVPLFRVFVPLFRFCTTVTFFARLFGFSTIEQKRNSVFCTTVPCFCTTVPFSHYCSVFPQRNKSGTVCLHTTVLGFFCTSVPFSHNRTKTECSVFCTTVPCFCTTVPFLHFCSVFPQQNKNGPVYFVPLFCVFVPLFRFLHFCSSTVKFMAEATQMSLRLGKGLYGSSLTLKL